MTDRARRKALLSEYRQTGPEAGVYRIVNNRTQRVLLGSTTNLASIHNKLAFAKSTNGLNALDRRLRNDIRQFGIDAFSLDVLEVLERKPGMTDAEIKADLKTLEALCRDQLEGPLFY